MRIIYFALYLIFLLGFSSCSEDQIVFSDDAYNFSSIQIQKFDYGIMAATGQAYQGYYSANKDTVYFDVTHFPDEVAPTYYDWQLQATLPNGASVLPGLSGVKDLTDPMDVVVTAPDRKTKVNVTIKLRIFEVPYGNVEKGFGKYNKLFELEASQLGGWIAGNQRSCALIGDKIVVSNMDQPFLVYDKLTGTKQDLQIPKPAGVTFYEIYHDHEGILLANTYEVFSASAHSGSLKIYRWINGLDKAPELFYELPLSKIPATGSHGVGLKSSVWGSTQGNAQFMFDINGIGSSDTRAVRVSVENGVPSSSIDVFDTGVSSIWQGKAVAMSATGRSPYAAAHLGLPQQMRYVDYSGKHDFAMGTDNFFHNKTNYNISAFEFNNSRFLATLTVSWPGDIRLLIFCLDDPSLIGTTAANMEQYLILNPFKEDALFKAAGGAGDVKIQVQEDGETALVYVMVQSTGIVAYELTKIGGPFN